jgi:hypothetical protein
MEQELKTLDDLHDVDKEYYVNVFKSWKTCFDRHVSVNAVKGQDIHVRDEIYIDGRKSFDNISSSSTIFFSNCENINILLSRKVNHIIIDNCCNVNLKVTSGIISGIDVLHSQNINLIVTNKDIFYMSFGDVSKSNIYIDKPLALNTSINTLHCNITNFILERFRYLANVSIFSGFNAMAFIQNSSSNTFELHCVNQDNDEGIIYPQMI